MFRKKAKETMSRRTGQQEGMDETRKEEKRTEEKKEGGRREGRKEKRKGDGRKEGRDERDERTKGSKGRKRGGKTCKDRAISMTVTSFNLSHPGPCKRRDDDQPPSCHPINVVIPIRQVSSNPPSCHQKPKPIYLNFYGF
jgi:hypothetical protein